MTPDQQYRLLELFAGRLQETLTEAEQLELQAALRADGDARKLWFLHQDLELGLKCLTQAVNGTAEYSRQGAMAIGDSANADVGLGAHLPTNSAPSSRASWLIRRNPAMSAIALLCLLAMVMFGVQISKQIPATHHAVGNKIANDRAVKFTVESPTHGKEFTLPNEKGKMVAVHFLLQSECPFCLKLTHDYSLLATSDPDVLHLFLKPDSTDEIKIWAGKISQEGLKNPPVIYRDPDARLAKEFGIPEGYKFHGHSVHYPALVLLDSSGKELFRYVGKNNSDRMRPDDFIAKLALVTDRR